MLFLPLELWRGNVRVYLRVHAFDVGTATKDGLLTAEKKVRKREVRKEQEHRSSVETDNTTWRNDALQ